MLKEAKIVKPTKEILCIEPKVGDEWDAGNLPCGCAYRRVRVTVRKDADDKWTVFCVAYRGAERLNERVITVLPCETCAKALALCLVFGSGYAVCVDHDDDRLDNETLFDGTVAILLSALSIGSWDALDEGSRHRILWAVHQILGGELDWQKAIAAWEKTEAEGLPLNAAIRYWDAEMRWS
jgi:hypothetical protein